ncbi:cardiolipin synthase [Paenibacillus sp. MMS18-CY102]|uniref:cardiolipin synthase n=1 Tax=Paenibacillus sp. MMS18-CY102 TaxID=2682849 RepID=UPI001365F9A6|nr:cardiolipin synthase [Paenibacillus sp. MMS18-CY102]MWC31098.1 cardiolipin synthase [Paenibacillus sp. MMS18-CY102]
MTWNTELTLLLLPVNILLAGVLVFMERRNVAATWSWLMVLLFVPVVGFVLYMILGQNMRRRKLYKWDKRDHAYLKSMIAEQSQKLEEGWPDDKEGMIMPYRKLIDMNLKTSRSLLTLRNEVDFYTEGLKKFEQLLADIAAATQHIHMQYYIFNNDGWGRKVRDALTAKAREGVQVRLLYDDIGSRKLNDRFFTEFDAAGGQRAIFFPSRIPYFNFRINYRNHRKIVIIDGLISYTGGFNVGNEYVGLDQRFGHWRDTHMRLRGEAVHSLQRMFLMDWGLATHQSAQHLPEFFPDPVVSGDGQLAVQFVAGGPSDQWRHVENALLHMIHSAKRTIWLQTPYLIPDESLLNALRIASLSGIDVRVMIPHMADHMFVHWASRYYVGELLQAGVKCYLYTNGFLHAKMMVVDGRIATVGTANFDIRSLKLNFEVNGIFYDWETAQRLESIYEQDVEESIPFTLEDYNNRSAWSKFNESISKLLSPIL